MKPASLLGSKKHRIFEIIQIAGGSDTMSRTFDRIIIVLIILSIVVTTAQTFSLPEIWIRILDVLEAVCMIAFTVEYALRLWTADLLYPSARFPYLRFLISLPALIDLFSILPFYLSGLIPAGMVVFRLIRVARILRLFRINRYLDPVAAILSILRRKAKMIFASWFLVFVLMFSASLLLYYAEHEAQPDVFKNAFSGLWWSVSTLSTTGYGDIYPVTFLGKMLAIMITLLGMCIVAVPTGIITAGFMEVIRYTDPNSRDSEEHMSSFGKLLDISTTVTSVLSPGLADHDASSIEQIPLESFVGSCIVETMSGRVTAERIGSVISKASGEASRRILLRGDAVLTEDAVRFLIQYHCLLIGFSQNNESELYTSQHMDSKLYSLQCMNAESRILLAGRVILLTGLDLTGIDDGEYMLHASPVLVSGAYTSPCRAYLIRTY